MSVKLIAVDMDGTVLDSSSGLPEVNRRALEIAYDRGVYVVLCTGRTMTELYPCLEHFDGVRYAVCTNGGFVVDLKTGERICEQLLPFETADAVLEAAERFDARPEVFFGGRAYLDRIAYDNPFDYHIGQFKDLLARTCVPVDDVRAFLNDGRKSVEKMNLFCRRLEDRDRLLNACLGFDAAVTYSIPGNVEINSELADKGRGLESLCGFLGISGRDVVAFGDSLNDVSMLEFAGMSVAMENAIPEVKSVADMVAPSNDSGGVGLVLMDLFASDNRKDFDYE